MECHTLEAMKKRFACKNYLNKEIEDDKLGLILEAGRLSPSSFGLEHWHFHVCRSQDILWTCPAQESMKTAPVTVVITCNNHTFFDPEGSFFKERMSRFPLPFEESKQDYMHHYNHLDSKELDQWSRAQSYIAVANMTTVASELGIQSCIIEG
ncbi:MAG: nitroreductase family protein, partial [Sphaerochaetaceae bacterium]|nr:nitroreductase family protein [Sphaerochaetaceae bacterium]